MQESKQEITKVILCFLHRVEKQGVRDTLIEATSNLQLG